YLTVYPLMYSFRWAGRRGYVSRKWGPESSRASEEEVANKKSRCMDESDGNRKTKALSDKQLLQVAETLGQEWEQAAIYLKLSITDLDNIKAE
ncbi:hypothetical protein NHX12_000086, partial [Muraenolepis orangiensis]